jgi:hypothetical protein
VLTASSLVDGTRAMEVSRNEKRGDPVKGLL